MGFGGAISGMVAAAKKKKKATGGGLASLLGGAGAAALGGAKSAAPKKAAGLGARARKTATATPQRSGGMLGRAMSGIVAKRTASQAQRLKKATAQRGAPAARRKFKGNRSTTVSKPNVGQLRGGAVKRGGTAKRGGIMKLRRKRK